MTTHVRSASPAPYISQVTDADDAIIRQALDLLDERMRKDGSMLTDPTQAASYVSLQLGACAREVFGALFMDTRHRVIAWEELFYGTIDGAEVHPREVAKRALHHNAAAVILAHNHPSGNMEPSAADRAVTARIKQALALIDVRVLDHFVVAGGSSVSLAARGWV
jgi:DNA repair protein RadC